MQLGSLYPQVGSPVTQRSPFGDISAPVPVVELSNVTAISAGGQFSLALIADGTVRGWGDPGEGAQGTGITGVTKSTFVPTETVLSDTVAIDAGARHSLFIVRDGKVGCSGTNFLSQCGRVEIGDISVPMQVGPGLRATP